MEKLKTIYSSAYSASISIIAVAVVTIYGDLNAPFKNWLASFTGHHWVTKSWMTIIIFVLGFGIMRLFPGNKDELKVRKSLYVLIATSCIGVITLLLFYIYEFFSH